MAGKPPKKPRKTTSFKKDTVQPAATVTPIEQTHKGTEPNDRKLASLDHPIREQIRVRAYELFVERGRHEGHDREDWERAEAEILAKFQTEKSA